MRAFLANLDGGNSSADKSLNDAALDDLSCQDPTSIFHHRRLDYDTIVELVPPGASVLDLGCGNGGLLARLRRRGCGNVVGIELDEHAFVACVQRGLDVVQADLDHGLSPFADGQFDFVVLSQTLQAVMDVEVVLKEILRVGRRGIISFPNIGYWKLRKHLYEEGRAPRAGSLLGYQWYNSPNVRFLSIADFADFCRDNRIQIHQQIALDTEAGCQVENDPNLNADMAIVVISR
jgi:homoserine O-acetyltransferase